MEPNQLNNDQPKIGGVDAPSGAPLAGQPTVPPPPVTTDNFAPISDSTPSTMPPAEPGLPGTPTEPVLPQAPKPSGKKKWLFLLIFVMLLAATAGGYWWWHEHNKKTTAPPTTASNKTTVTYAVDWVADSQLNGIKKDGQLVSKGLNQYVADYEKLHPDINIVVQQIPYDQYASKLKTLNDSGAAPDIYQIYSPWGASYVRNNMLDEPSLDVQNDVKQNYVSNASATINGKVWGYPTKIDNYALLYNKTLFSQAGITTAPKTWQDVATDAVKLTKKDAQGHITQYGFSFLKDNDWQVVDPFLSLLFTNGGSYLSTDYKQALVNSPAGVEALNAELQLFKNGSTDINGSFYDFGKSKVGMVISPVWAKANFSTDFGTNFSSTVGVVPFPYLKTPGTMQYGWFMGVMKSSQHKQAAWDFLKWFEADTQASGTTRYGDLLANTIGVIPARKVDFNAHKDVLGDFFSGVYVNQMASSTAEPNVIQSTDIKAALMTEIQSAWTGQKTAQQALDTAKQNIDKILQQYY